RNPDEQDPRPPTSNDEDRDEHGDDDESLVLVAGPPGTRRRRRRRRIHQAGRISKVVFSPSVRGWSGFDALTNGPYFFRYRADTMRPSAGSVTRRGLT